MYLYSLNLYPSAPEFSGALDGIMTLGWLASLAYSTLAAVGLAIAFVALASFGAKHLF